MLLSTASLMFHLLAVTPLQTATTTRVDRQPLPPGETLIDSVVASIDLEGDRIPRFALTGELVLLIRTELLVHHCPDPLRTAVDASVTQGYLEQLMGELVVAREAERAGETDAAMAMMNEERRRVLSQMPEDLGLTELLDATGASPADFDRLVLRRTMAMRYLLARNARLLEPSEPDLHAAFEGPRYADLRATGTTFNAARAQVRQDLLRQALPGALRQYLRALGSRARVRVYSRAGGEVTE